MKEEYDSLLKNKVQDVMELSKGKKTMKNIWVFKIKRD